MVLCVGCQSVGLKEVHPWKATKEAAKTFGKVYNGEGK
jgi:hypothetical protein